MYYKTESMSIFICTIQALGANVKISDQESVISEHTTMTRALGDIRSLIPDHCYEYLLAQPLRVDVTAIDWATMRSRAVAIIEDPP